MTYISSSRSSSVSGLRRIQSDAAATQRPQQEDIRSAGPRGSDSADLSPVSKFLSELKTGAPVREELVARVKDEIEAGTYETPEKLDAVLDDVTEDLNFEL
jgi:anti-sigma28 factor (negative regulator of flagellin synthesis)